MEKMLKMLKELFSDKRAKLTILREMSIGMFLEIMSIIVFIAIFFMLAMFLSEGEGFTQNNFDRLVGDINKLSDGDSKIVTISLEDQYFIAGWNYRQTMLPEDQCKWNYFNDIERPISCDGMCLCLCKLKENYCGEAECINDPDIGNFDSWGLTDECKYVYINSIEQTIRIQISREDNVMTLKMLNPSDPPSISDAPRINPGTIHQ